MKLGAHWKGLIAGCVVVAGAAFVIPRFVRPPYLAENRRLADAPPWPQDLAGLKTFRKGVDAYVADRFPARPYLIGLLNFLRYRIGVSGSDRVLVGRDGWLYYDNGSHMAAADGTWRVKTADERLWLRSLAGRTEALRAQGAAYLLLVPPDKEDVYPQHAPAWFHLDPNRNAVRLTALAQAAHAGEVLYLAPDMAKPAKWGLKLYDRYETHWTGLGAYQGYVALMQKLQAMGAVHEGPRPLESFTQVDHGAATPQNLALMLGIASFVTPDFPEFDDPAMEAQLKTTYLTPQVDWTKPHVVDTGVPGKPVLLITMDSFSTALMPFLYSHFSRIIVAHDQDGFWRQDLIDRFKPNIVITEVLESGMPFAEGAGPEASPEAVARIEQVLAHPPAPAAPPPPRPASAPFALRPPEALAPVQGLEVKVIEGGRGDDKLEGTPGPDAIMGYGGNDTIHGGGGNDIIRGGKGDDVIDGGDGDDWISGDRGDDTLTGGRGADTFHSSAGAGLDLVTDFNAGEGDRIELDNGTPFTVSQEGADTVIHMQGTRLVLKNVKAASLPRGAIYYK